MSCIKRVFFTSSMRDLATNRVKSSQCRSRWKTGSTGEINKSTSCGTAKKLTERRREHGTESLQRRHLGLDRCSKIQIRCLTKLVYVCQDALTTVFIGQSTANTFHKASFHLFFNPQTTMLLWQPLVNWLISKMSSSFLSQIEENPSL